MNKDSSTNLNNDTRLLEGQAWKHHEDKEYEDAIAICDKIIHIDSKNCTAYQIKIGSYRKTNKFTDALTLLKEALNVHPQESGLLSERFWIYAEQNQCDNAVHALEARFHFDSDLKAKWDESIFSRALSLLKSQNDFEKAQQLIDKAIGKFNKNLSILNEQGWLHFAQMHYDEAIEVFKEILSKKDLSNEDPLNASALQGQIASLRMKGQFTDAGELADAALHNHQKNSPGINSERGWIYFKQGDYSKAADCFKKVITLSEKNPDPYHYINLAWSLFRQKEDTNLDTAIKHCWTALKISPNLAEAFGCLGNIAFRQGRIREAEEYFLRSIRVNAKKGHYADLGALYIKMGRYEEAKEELQKALKNNPNDKYAYFEMGYLYLQTDKFKDAISQFRIAAEIDSNKPNTFNALALAHMADNNLIEAEYLLRNAIRRFDESKRSGLHLMLCRLLTRMGDEKNNPKYYDEALLELEKVKSHPEEMFYGGIVRFKRKDYADALKNFQVCLDNKNKYQFEAELNISRIKALMETQVSFRSNADIFLVMVCFAQIIALWVLRFMDGITDTSLIVLLPILLGVMIVGLLLPELIRFKLTGFEVEVCEPKPKKLLESGPNGGIDFCKADLPFD